VRAEVGLVGGDLTSEYQSVVERAGGHEDRRTTGGFAKASTPIGNAKKEVEV